MEWVIIAVLGVLFVLSHTLYWRALSKGRTLRSYALWLLLDEEAYAVQRQGLRDLVHCTDARDAGGLSIKVELELEHLAAHMGHSPLGIPGLLWKLKNTPPPDLVQVPISPGALQELNANGQTTA
jgi:hypothetical protein